MASIINRNGKYAVVFNYTDQDGKRRQKWETFTTKKEAQAYKAKMEYAQAAGMQMFVPSAKTVDDLMAEYISQYGKQSWSHSYYDKAQSLVKHYVSPYIGKMRLKDLSPRLIENYYHTLLLTDSALVLRQVGKKKADNQKVSARTVKEIHKLLHSAFRQAERWEMVESNPFDKVITPKYKEVPREIWELDDLKKALEACDNPILELCINLAFSCSLRLGEILGLTWDCVHISDELIDSNAAWIYVEKQLQRITVEAAEAIDSDSIRLKFPSNNTRVTTILVLKDPKTKSSIRKIYLPRTVAEMLKERKKQIDIYKDYLGDEFHDYGLVICYENGTPMEGAKIRQFFQKLIKENNLRPVVFHSLRHSSTTYKLKLSGGDIKAVQGDTGHAEAAMITERYAHILDDDRRINAEKFEEMFYQGKESSENKGESEEMAIVINRLKESPELLKLLKSLIS
ncbi:MAG: site-specific integrase [Oscillospiraceae bacterium]|nr:site-specific integrase [Oscillospiraceae bacterium]